MEHEGNKRRWRLRVASGSKKAVKLIKDPIQGVQQGVQQVQQGVQQVIEVVKKARRGVAIGWAVALILSVLCYILDLGAGSLWNNDDALVALATQGLRSGALSVAEAARIIPPPSGAPLALWELAGLTRVLGENEAVLRLLPVLSAIGCALCLLALAIDVGVGRHAGGLGGLFLLALPMTYQLSHRVLPDMLTAFASTGAVALLSHCLHGHKFDRHILPHHRDEEAPAPLPLRRWPMVLAAAGVGAAALVSPQAAMTALLFAVFDILLAHRYLLRKRRVWLALSAGAALTALAMTVHPGGVMGWLRRPAPGVPMESVKALWHQGDSFYGRHVGHVIIVAAGFGVLLGSLRRPSRPLLVWMAVAIGMTWLGEIAPPPRGLGLVLPPLSLCAAVGFESPVRWLGRLGMVVTGAALAGILIVYAEGDAVLHQDDAVKVLAQVQRHAQPEALLCTLGLPAYSPTFYSTRHVARFATPADLLAALGKDQPLSCQVMRKDLLALQKLLVSDSAPPPMAAPAAGDGRHGKGKPRRPAPTPAGPFGSVLATVLDIEEPPPDTWGPDVVLVSR